MFWYWSLLALVLAVGIVSIIGLLTRYYIGKRMIAWADNLMLRVPVLNKIYGTIKQVDAGVHIRQKQARSRPSCSSNIRARAFIPSASSPASRRMKSKRKRE